jgi:hypothetical protein
MRGFAEYLVSCVLIIAIIGAIAWGISSPAGRQAVLVSAALALVLQLLAFGVARSLQRRNLLLGWGLGSTLRLVALVLYAVAVAKLWRAPIGPALLSFVAFLFVTTVVEPVFLRR